MPATDAELRQALIAADKAGNREDAKIIATELQRRMSSQQAELQGMEDDRAMARINRGIATIAGMPVDVVNAGLGLMGAGTDQPFAGSASIRSGMRSMGIDVPEEPPSTVKGAVFETLGEATGAQIPFLKGAQALSKGKGVPAGLAKQLEREFIEHPARALTTEATAATGAGIGRGISEQRDYTPGKQVLAELGGGLIGSTVGMMSPARAVTGIANKAIKWLRMPFTEAGAFDRASRRVQSLVKDPKAVAQQIEDLSGTTLLPSARTNEPGLMALEKAVLDRDPAEAARISRASQEATDDLVKSIKESGNIRNTKDFLEKKRVRMERSINARIESASDDAVKAVNALKVDATPSDVSKVLKGSLEEALADAKVQEALAWQAVPQDTILPTAPFVRKLAELESKLSMAQADDMPQVARRVADALADGANPKETSLRQMDGLYKKLGEVARGARAEGKFNKARLADELRDSVLESMSRAKGGKEIREAVDFARGVSLQIKQKFHRGAVGRILGYAKEGGTKLPPEMAIASTVGRPREAGVAAAKDVLAATSDIHALGAIQDWLKLRFVSQAVRNDVVDPAKAQAFTRQYSELLDMFPSLKTQFRTAESSADALRRAQKAPDAWRRKYDRPEVSAVAAILKAPARKEIPAILRSPKPDEAMAEVVNAIGGDATAMAGLKAGISDYILQMISMGAFNPVTEQRVISGMAMKEMLADESFLRAISKVYKPKELSKLKETATVLAQFEKQALQRYKETSITTDAPGRLINIITGVVGARIGAKFSSGSGASIQAAHIGSKEARRTLQNLTADRAEQVLIDAIEDPELMKALLLNPLTANKAQLAKRERTLRAWAVGPGSRLLDDEE
jgi:hypothetical protein